MSHIVGYDLTPDSGTTLRKVLKQNLAPYLEEFESISAASSKVRILFSYHLNTGSLFWLLYSVPTLCVSLQEFSLEKAMQAMVHIWDGISLQHQPYRETGVSILTSWDEIQTILDDQIVKTQTMRGSPFIKPFEKQIKVSWSWW